LITMAEAKIKEHSNGLKRVLYPEMSDGD